MSLRDLRRLLRLPQREVARRLQKGQEEVSRIENRADLRLSTLQSYVRSLGGTLELLCRFEDRAPVRLRTGTPEGAPANSTGRLLPRLPRLITRHAAAIVTLCQQHAVRRLAVLGSALRPDFDPASNGIDFAVEFASNAQRSAAHQYFDFKAALEALLGHPVDLLEPSATPPGARNRISEESQIALYADVG